MAQPTATVHRPLSLGVVHVRAGRRHGESAVRPETVAYHHRQPARYVAALRVSPSGLVSRSKAYVSA